MTGHPFDRCGLPIMAFGQGWLVASKPSGMSVHNDPGSDLCSVLNRYLQASLKAADAVAYDDGYGLHPVHRLDRATSGVILLSCRKAIFDHLAQQFVDGTVTKRYLALAHGEIQPAAGWQSWRWPLTPKAAGRRTPQGKGKRRPCETRYRVIANSRHYSLLGCRLLTGRTHQIRRHAALAGHPLVGDRRYGSLRACRYLETHYHFNRLGLHAAGLSIRLPDEEAPQRFETPDVPDALRHLIEKDTGYRPID